MRKFSALLRPYLQNVLNLTRHENNVTQENMAEIFYMSTRSYCDLERGKSGFSAVSLIILLADLPDDVMVWVVRGFFSLLLDALDEEVI
jgi:DNA-binding XRE family transcriptional regulator|nr:hypothetical protein [Acutalibacter muris]